MEELWENEDSYRNVDLHSSAFLGSIQLQRNCTTLDITAPNSQGWTPLMYSSCKGWTQDVEYLLKRGIFQHERDSAGRTCLMLAVGSGDLSTVKLLCKAENNIDNVDKRGWTALLYAVWFCREACIDHLLSCGADPNSLNHEGETPRGLAEKSGIDSIIALFKKKEWTPAKESACTKNYPTAFLTPQHKRSALTLPFNIKKRKNTYSPNATSSRQKENVPPSTPPNQINKIDMLANLVLSAPPKINPRGSRPPFGLLPQEPSKNRNNSPAFPTLSHHHRTKLDTVESFLQQLNLEKYWPIFRNEEVDLETLLTFEEHNLTELGIILYGPRMKIMAAIREYREIHGKTSFFEIAGN